MTAIKFDRVERDCPANKRIREEYAKSLTKPHLIYDFKVLINDEHRATMSRDYTGKGYTIQDVDGDPIDPPLSHYTTGRKIESQGRFEYHVKELLAAGKIPTLAELEIKRTAKAAKIAQRKAEQAEQYRINSIQRAGMFLYAALQLARAEIHNPGAARASGIDILDVIEQAFEEADWKEHRDADLIEYEAKYR